MGVHNPFQRKSVNRDVEDELQFHVDLLTQNYLEQEMSFDEARNSALKRFGNMGEIKNECVKISGRNNTVSLLTKVGLLMIFLFGLLMRIFIPVENFHHLSDVLMSVAVLGRLFMYVSSLRPSFFEPKPEESPLQLVDKTQSAIPSYDQRALTPLERVISDK